MALLGKGVLAIWNGIQPEAEDEFLKWHVHEHIPERVAIPGFLRGRRYVAVDGAPKYFNFYETTQASDLLSDAYKAELDRPSEWTKAVVRSFLDTSRTICNVAWTGGIGEGVFVETLRLETSLDAAEFRQRLAMSLLAPVVREAGVVGVHLLEGLTAQGNGETAETRLRGGGDEVAAWIILVETVTGQVVENLRRGVLSDSRLEQAGVERPARRGHNALQFSLTKAELDRLDEKVLERRDRRLG